ncbi:anthranilate synthase component I family protein [Vampirovibrio sp.]|uniref:anthranilate synthase component I family protein n=1 Tax=Vampirovibrio sp. TaxID=2717857 RepID=UPI0035941B62
MPLTIESYLSDTETPVSLFHRLNLSFPLMFLFESTDGDNRVGRFSILGLDPVLSFRLKNGTAMIQNHRDGTERLESCTDPMARLKALQAETLPDITPLPASFADLPLSSGWVGYMGYGTTQYFEQIPQPEQDVLNVPDIYMALYDSVIVFDHLYRRIHVISHRAELGAQALLSTIQTALHREKHELRLLALPDISDERVFDSVQYATPKPRFLEAIRQAKQWIVEGQIFQIVLAQRFSLPVQCSTLDIYRTVTAINPSPYAYYLKFPEFTYLGSSPETFIRSRNGQVTLKALAGTRPRGTCEQSDRALTDELKASRKEMAEHRMLVDLGRNDMGRICQPGSIAVGEIAQILRYTHVMHLATEIQGTLKAGLNGYDALKCCFPRGTVSGAPKIRALQLLAKLEPEQRGVYSGMVGYIDANGNADGAIAIRSALIQDGMAHIHAGAGIVHHSEPEAEYEETRNKAKSMVKAILMAERMNADVSATPRGDY